MRIEYQLIKKVEETKYVNIENENFICVEHKENGSIMWTAFIGKGENNNDKITIKISPHGGVFHIKIMSGDALLNATNLLKDDRFNNILLNSVFIKLYNEQKQILAIELQDY